LNDLNDLAADRQHREKRFRPLAAGQIRPGPARLAAALLGAAGVGAAFSVGLGFVAVTMCYVVVTMLYTRYLKRVALLDVLALAGLWTLRILAGAVAIGVDLSVWLLSFAAFLFLSLSLLKRCAELQETQGAEDRRVPGRGYWRRDLPVLQLFGVATGTVSVLVLALFVDSPNAIGRYPHPERLWLMCPAIWFWLGRLWLETGRGHMHHDPVVFSLRDPASWCALGVVVVAFAASVASF
jgi:4-hydroxybenzoate polyprenyltransferase